MTYAPKPGDRAILRVTVENVWGGEKLATVITRRVNARFTASIPDLEPDLTPEPPKPLEVGDGSSA